MCIQVYAYLAYNDNYGVLSPKILFYAKIKD